MDNAKTIDLSNLRAKLGNSAQSLSAKAKGFYDRNGHWVRATASTGLYVGGYLLNWWFYNRRHAEKPC